MTNYTYSHGTRTPTVSRETDSDDTPTPTMVEFVDRFLADEVQLTPYQRLLSHQLKAIHGKT